MYTVCHLIRPWIILPQHVFCFFYEECMSDKDITKQELDSSIVTCHPQKSCTGVQCCVQVPHTGIAVEAFVDISPCGHLLQVGIENLKFNRSLYGYKFGEKEKFDLFGMIVVE